MGDFDAVRPGEVDAEHAAERAQDAAGLGGGFEEGGHVRVGGQEMRELATIGGGGLGVADQPGAAARQPRPGRTGGGRRRALDFSGIGRAGGTGRTRPGEGAVLPADEQPLEAVAHAVEAVPDPFEKGDTGLGGIAVVGNGGLEAGDDEGETFDDVVHGRHHTLVVMFVSMIIFQDFVATVKPASSMAWAMRAALPTGATVTRRAGTSTLTVAPGSAASTAAVTLRAQAGQ
jgi:hypothetical protein